MPYIPKFNPVSLQEMAYAPALMRQQHDQAISNNMELANQLKFDYLKQDAPTIEPVLQGYSKSIEDISSDLAKYGFNNDVRNRIVGERSKFIADDKLDKYKKNYKEAMTGWEDTKKSLMSQKASGRDVENMRNAYFGKYKGAYDNEGMYQEFAPGATSGVYDVTEDARKAFAGIGSTGRIVGKTGTIVSQEKGKDRNGNPLTYFSVTDSKTGQRLDNLTQREAVAQYLKREYGDPQTDRGLYAKISGLTPDYINSAVDQVSASMAESKYAQLPQVDTNISGINADPTRGKPSGIPLYSIYTHPSKGVGDSEDIADEDKMLSKYVNPSTGEYKSSVLKQHYTPPKSTISEEYNAAGEYVPSSLNKKFKTTEEEQKDRLARWTQIEVPDESADKAFNTRKNKYSLLYNTIKKNGGTDADFIKATSTIKEHETATLDTNVGFDDPTILKDTWGKIQETPNVKAFTKMKELGSNEPDLTTLGRKRVTLSAEDINSKLKGLGMTKDDLFNRQATITSSGKIHFQLGGEEYELNEDAFPRQSGGLSETFNLLKKGFNDYSLSKKELDDISSKEYTLGDKLFSININPQNPFDRKLMVRDVLGLHELQEAPLSAVQVEMAKVAHKGLGNKNEIKATNE